MFLRRRKVAAVLVAAVAFSTVLAACGSSKSTTGGSSGAANNSPIKIGNFTSVTGTGFAFTAPQAKAAIDAAVSSINDAGGVNGHKLELSFCDEKFDPNQEVTCARQMVSDNVSAVVAPEVFFGSGSIPLLERAGIPVLASQGLSPAAEFTSPVSFPLGSSYSWFWGLDYAMLKAGGTKFVVFSINNATAGASSKIAIDGLKAAGVTSIRSVVAEPTATDLSPQAAEAIAGGTDAVIYAGSPQLNTKAIAALRDAGFKGLIGSLTDVFSQKAIDGLGSKAEGVLLSEMSADPNDTTNPGIQQFRADMAKYAPGQPLDTLGVAAWGAVHLFATIAKTAKSFDAAGILAAVKNADVSAKDAPVFGGFKIKGVTSPIPSMPQLLVHNAQIGSIVNGKVKVDGQLFDVFKVLADWKASH